MTYVPPYPNWVFSLFSAIGFVLCCIPFPWHLEAWNTGTCLFMAWTGLACLGFCINSIIWNGNAINWAPVWCDIFTKFMIGLNVALPAASLCINRRLYHIASVTKVTISRAEKRRQIAVDLGIGVGIPIIAMALQYIAQGHRFDIYEDVGCWNFTYGTWVAFVLVNTPPLAIGLVSGIYAILSIRAFNRSRSQSKEMLSSYSNLTSSRYFRLMALAATDVIFSVPLSIFAIVANTRHTIPRWISWEDTHSNFSRVDQFPALLWRASWELKTGLEMVRWVCVACAFVFFAYFGFADEARKHYRSAISSVAKRVGVSTGSFGSSSGLFSSSGMSKGGVGSHPGSMPGFVVEKSIHRDSFDGSFSDASSNIKEAGSFSTPSTPVVEQKSTPFTNIFASKKKFNEQVFKPGFQYNDLVLPDIGGTLDNSSRDDVLTIPSSISSTPSSICIPEPAVIRREVADVPVSVSVDPRRHSHDMV